MLKTKALVRKPVQIRLSPGEHKILLEAAKRAGLPLSSWIRVITLAEAREIQDLAR